MNSPNAQRARILAPLLTGLLFLLLYALVILAQLDSGGESWVARFISQQINTNDEGSMAEVASALLWLAAGFLFLRLAWRGGGAAGSRSTSLWLLLFALLCFFAFGEEISWGDHLFEYDSVLKDRSVNYQFETNVHNLNLSELLGLEPGHALYPLLENANTLLNPLFYLVVLALWVLIPFWRGHRRSQPGGWLDHYPSTGGPFQILFLVQLVLYVAVDKSLAEAGFLFELFVAFAAPLAAFDIGLRRGGPD